MFTKSILAVLLALVALSNATSDPVVIEMEKNSDLFTIVTVENRGAYVARFFVIYILDGELLEKGSGRFEVWQKRSIFVEPGATAVLVRAEVDIFWNNWSTIFTQNFPVAETACFKVGGTTLNTNWSKNDC